MKANLTEGGHYYYYHSLGYFDWVYCHLTGIGSVHNCRVHIYCPLVPDHVTKSPGIVDMYTCPSYVSTIYPPSEVQWML